jgi:hypothetical protein
MFLAKLLDSVSNGHRGRLGDGVEHGESPWCVHEIARRWPITPHHRDLIAHYAPIPRDNLDSADELYTGDNFPQTG